MEKIDFNYRPEGHSHNQRWQTTQIIKFNSSRASEGNYKSLVIFLRDPSSHLVGGLLGETYWQWLYIDVLWVHESFRGEGYGNALLATAEQEAMI